MKQRKFNLSPEAIVALEKREHETRESFELRRLQAVRLYGSGAEMRVVQQVCGASRRTVQRWVDRYEIAGLAGLKAGWQGGNHRGLSEAQRWAIKRQLQHQSPTEVLAAGEEPQGDRFRTVDNVRALVETHYGVHYRSVRSYHALLHESGLSYQRPEGIYHSRPSEAVIAEFEADAEKK